jgi:hydrogenase expression/formation protein HypE
MSAQDPACPVPLDAGPRVLLGHGGGGRLMHELLSRTIVPALTAAGDAHALEHERDAKVITLGGQRLAITTDGFVVKPAFFPGGDVGSLAVHGAVNDLAMVGARPLGLTVGLVLEEGTPIADVERALRSLSAAAATCEVAIWCGDTKVVERGKGDGLFITTTGLGVVPDDVALDPTRIRAGDALLVSGDLGRHGIAVLAARGALAVQVDVESDSAPLVAPVQALLSAGVRVRCLRDLTRGGLASGVVELARASGLRLRVREDAVPVGDAVRGACELLGLDPFLLANEGRLLAVVDAADADRALAVLRTHAVAVGAAHIGDVLPADARGRSGAVRVSALGVERVLELPAGELLPRIC